MKLRIKKLTLQSAVEKCASLVAGAIREIAPVLKNFHLEAREGSLRIIATDTDLTVIADTTLVVVDEPGDAIIPAKMFWDIVKECDDTDIELTVGDDHVAHVVTPTTTWDIQLMKEKYPPIPVYTDIKWSVVDAKGFATALRKVKPAIAKDMNRPELTLVRCDTSGIVATDGPRMHNARFEVKEPVEIQSGAVDELLKILRHDIDDKIQIGQTQSHILFKIGNDVFLATKLQVAFPMPVVAKQLQEITMNVKEMQCDREELINAVNRTRITADEETNRILLNLTANKLILETKDKANNQARETINVHWSQDPAQFSLNWMFLRDALDEMESPNICFVFGEDKGQRKAPVVLKEDNFIAVINQQMMVSPNVATAKRAPAAASATTAKK
jgi:DNA polymerase-3 subunit beta